MTSEERKHRIEEYLQRVEFASLEELSQHVEASVSTVRRDLTLMEATEDASQRNKLDAGLAIVAERIGVPDLLKLPKANSSPAGTTREDLKKEQISWIESRFKRDREFMDRHADKYAGR